MQSQSVINEQETQNYRQHPSSNYKPTTLTFKVQFYKHSPVPGHFGHLYLKIHHLQKNVSIFSSYYHKIMKNCF
jgi:hypothetical protein